MSLKNTSTTAEETMEMVISKQKTGPRSRFLKILWNIVNDPNVDDIIGWNSLGNGFIIYDQVKFVRELLPLYYHHNNLTSFIRQLCFYDFHKVANINTQMEYIHSYFLKGSEETLAHITRKKARANQKQENNKEAGEMVIPEHRAVSIPLFLQQLWNVVNDPNVEHIIGWNNTGDAFVIYDQEKVTELLSQFFKHSSLASFIRQLNVYNFHRVANSEHEMEFEHSYFLKGSPESLVLIPMKIYNTSINNQSQENVKKWVQGVKENIEDTVEIVTPEQAGSIPVFLQKLWKIVNDPKVDQIIGWNNTGNGIIIYNQKKFVTELLPQYFLHNNLASFIRQLNFYSFHKVSNVKNPQLEFAQSYFLKGSPETLALIPRKNGKSRTNQKQQNNKEAIEMVIQEQKAKSVPLFLRILWKMVNDPNTEHIVGWNSTGDGFVIYDKIKLTELLSQYYKHNNFLSFIRQLNQYGFRKVTSNKCEMRFEHSCFVKGSPEHLALIRTKRYIKTITNQKQIVTKYIESTSTSNINVIPEQIAKSVPYFVQNLWQIVNYSNAEHIISWNSTGDGFIIYDKEKANELFPQYFRHNNWNSFITQLSTYDFHKVDSINRYVIEYKNSYFLKGSPETLHLITNKRNVKAVTNLKEENFKNLFKGVQENFEEAVPLFVLKLWKIVDDPNTEHIIGWNSTDDGFIIYDIPKVIELLSLYFKDLNLANFIRQLNFYDFRKVANNKHELEYEHSCFLKGLPETLALITNKKHVLSITNQKVVNVEEQIKDIKENSEEDVEMKTLVPSISSTSTSTSAEEHVKEITKAVISEQTVVSLPAFVQKLWNIVDDPNTDHIIGWNDTGDGFIIFDKGKVTELLPQYFKHNKLSSFIKQLNNYDFYIVANNKHELEYEHPCFLKGSPETLVLITKKRHALSITNQKVVNVEECVKDVNENSEEAVEMVTLVPSIPSTSTSTPAEEHVKEVTKVVIPEQIMRSIPLFVQELWSIVNEPNTDHIIYWNDTGDGFLVYDKGKLTELLPQYFKHNNLTSFIRQLNIYDFHNVTNNRHELEYEHSCFLKGSPETLVLITSKKHALSITNQKEVNVEECIKDVNENNEEAVQMVTLVPSISSTSTSTPAEEHVKEITKVVIPEQTVESIHLFVQKLWSIVNDPNTDHIIGWNNTGDGFIIYDKGEVTKLFLHYFRHNSWHNFISQLSIYNFKKIGSLNRHEMEYKHSYFLKGLPETLDLITNKRNVKYVTNQQEENLKKRFKAVQENIEESVPLFVLKLWKIVNDPNTEHIVGWNNTDDGFIIYDSEKVTELLPQYFKHNNLASFIRQLNLYDFNKVANNKNVLEFEHSCFLKDSPETLALIRKKKHVSSISNQKVVNVKMYIKHVKENSEEAVEMATLVPSISSTNTSTHDEEHITEITKVVIPEQTAESIPLFVRKLWNIVNDLNTDHIIGWNNTGDGFIIYDKVKVTKLLQQYFKHRSLLSFIRQLNQYGIHKVVNNKHEMEFEHSCFHKGLPEALVLITKKKQQNMGKLIKYLKEMTSKVILIDKEIRLLKQENAALWSEIRSLHIKYSQMS